MTNNDSQNELKLHKCIKSYEKLPRPKQEATEQLHVSEMCKT